MSQRNVFDTEKKEEQQRRREYEKRLNHAIEEEELRRRVFNGRLSKMKEERDKNELKEGEKLRREEYIKILQYMKEYEHLRREEYEKINSLVQDIFNLKKVRVKLIRLKKSLIHFGYDEENFKNTGFTAREIIKAGFGVEELEAVGFTPAEIKLATSALKGSRDVQFNIRSSNSSQDMSEFIPDKINVRPYDHFDWVSALEQVKKEGLMGDDAIERLKKLKNPLTLGVLKGSRSAHPNHSVNIHSGDADNDAPVPAPPSRAYGEAFGMSGFYSDNGEAFGRKEFVPNSFGVPAPPSKYFSKFEFGGPFFGGSRRKKNKKRKLTRKLKQKPSRKFKRKTRTLSKRRVKKTRLYKNKK
jgi:hypothetical protein